MNILPMIGAGAIAYYVVTREQKKKTKFAVALPEARHSVYDYSDLPDYIVIGPGESFGVRLPEQVPSTWSVVATPPDNEIVHVDTFYQAPKELPGKGVVDYIFQGKSKGKGSIVFHRTVKDNVEPLEIVEILVEVD